MYPGRRLGSAEDLSWCHVLQSGCLGQQLVFVHPTSDQRGPLFPLLGSDAANAVDSL